MKRYSLQVDKVILKSRNAFTYYYILFQNVLSCVGKKRLLSDAPRGTIFYGKSNNTSLFINVDLEKSAISLHIKCLSSWARNVCLLQLENLLLKEGVGLGPIFNQISIGQQAVITSAWVHLWSLDFHLEDTTNLYNIFPWDWRSISYFVSNIAEYLIEFVLNTQVSIFGLCRTPRAAVYLILWTPKSYESPKASALTNLALRLIHDCLTETTYSAEISGLAYNVSYHKSWILGIWFFEEFESTAWHVLTHD